MSCSSRPIDHLRYMDWQTIAALALSARVAAFFIEDNLAFVLLVYAFLLIFSILARAVLPNICCRISCLRPRACNQGRSRPMRTILACVCAPFPRDLPAGSSACAPAAAGLMAAARCAWPPRRRQASACAALPSG